ncbi:MAG: hypothetical protein FJZ47_02095 [Candidatus Tectomicrobia bacterium]|uniref:Restriction endonuclease domain-containing protein n=1 Tax=Tectimicrobiota bacterium TaxID=2528274 RepID=A0A938B289_UNCTE|nr:hypothetical protein [Candidatus Tectomicrobia bacterium]
MPRGEAWEVVPNLAVEVVSSSDSAERVMTKVAEYFTLMTPRPGAGVVSGSARQAGWPES